MSYRLIDPRPFEGACVPAQNFGPVPKLEWLEIDRLVIDPTYQRHILRTGRKNILAIAQGFRWQKFEAITVSPIDSKRFALINGQHRTTAAAVCGIEKVPGLIIKATQAEQALAFASINGQVTAVSGLQLHAAKVAAGEPKSIALRDACAAAGVTICRYPVPQNNMKVGETLSVGTLQRQLEKYGRTVLVTALSCITKTGNGNVGMIRAPVCEALCSLLEIEPSWAEKPPKLLQAMNKIDLAAIYHAATVEAQRQRVTIASVLVDRISAHLASTMPKAA